MKLFSKILCPIDFSPYSRLTLHYGRQLAETWRSKLVLLHVKPSITEIYQSLVPELASYVSADERSLAETFNDFSGDWAGQYEKVISAGLPYEEILRVAGQMRADLIVMGAKGLSRLERLLLGGTTEKVVRRANCPVLTVHDGDPHLPAAGILFPTDMSSYANDTWPLVAEVARLYQAKVHIVHVLDVEQTSQQRRRDQTMRLFVEKLQAAVKKQLQESLDASGLAYDIVVAEKRDGVAPALMEIAENRKIDLIIMSAHGKSPLLPPFIGGITEKVVRLAHCPVMTVRHSG